METFDIPGLVALIDIPGDGSVIAMRRYIASTDSYDWAVANSAFGSKHYSCYNDDDVSNVQPLFDPNIYVTQGRSV